MCSLDYLIMIVAAFIPTPFDSNGHLRGVIDFSELCRFCPLSCYDEGKKTKEQDV